MISRGTIENIIGIARIEEIVGEFVTLRRRGGNLVGLCPFHEEKTPSFTVSPAKGIYKCFGCGKAGNVINFLMEHEHYSYPEALRYLADRYQIPVEEEAQTPEMQQEISEKESLYHLNLFAQEFFQKTLSSSEEGKAIGLSYLKERGFREDIIRKFYLGYNPGSKNSFSAYALSQGYKQDYLLKTGLSFLKEGRLIDRFQERIIFPVHSPSGRVIGFGGRILRAEKNRSKYINSPESEIYSKSKSLYGLYFARQAISSKDNCYLVEGYTDVIALHQAGIENVVASSGTSLTHDQIRIIRRYTKNITILYDGDPAGIKASFRGIDMILEEGLQVKIVLFPAGEDPDSFTRQHHPNDVVRFITDHSDNFVLFKTRLLLEETKGDPIKKAALIKEIVHTIALIPEGITRSLYIRECSAVTDISEQILQAEVRKILRNRMKKSIPDAEKPEDIGWTEEPAAQEPIVTDLHSADSQEKEVIRLLLTYGTNTIDFIRSDDAGKETSFTMRVADFIIGDILRDDLGFAVSGYAKIFGEYVTAQKNEKILELNFFRIYPDPEVARLAVDLVLPRYELSENWEKNNILVDQENDRIKQLVITALLAFKARKLDKMIAEKQHSLRQAQSPEELRRMMEELQDLKKSNILINKELGRIITK